MAKIVRNIYFSCYLIIAFSSCIKNPPPEKRMELNGINGSAHYYFSSKTGEVINIVKQEYINPIDYTVSINKDTLHVGEEFIVSFQVYKPQFLFTVSEPEISTFKGMYDPNQEPISQEFIFKAHKVGIVDFKGQIEYNTTTIPIEFKFLVLPND